MIRWKTEGTKLYQQLPKEMHEGWEACEPLRIAPTHIETQQVAYKTWNETKK